eukprot:5070402-Amphidinium_carterae.3
MPPTQAWEHRRRASGWSVQSMPREVHFGSTDSQNQDVQCSQCEGEDLGSMLGQNNANQYSQCQCHWEPRCGYTGEDHESQCSQDSFDSWGAGSYHPLYSRGAGKLPTQSLSARLSQDGFRSKEVVRTMDSVSDDATMLDPAPQLVAQMKLDFQLTSTDLIDLNILLAIMAYAGTTSEMST